MKTLAQTVLILLLASTIFSSCTVNRRIHRSVSKAFKKSALIDKYQVGFSLFDPSSNQTIFEKDAHKYFTPASNTKLFTFYAGLKISPDSIPSLRYIQQGDSLIFWGTGDPSFLHTVLKGTKAFNFLKQSDKHLFYAPGRYTGNFYGFGWPWNDYNDYYQAEINELPLIDNEVWVSADDDGALNVLPKTLSSCFYKDSAEVGKFNVKREFLTNKFHYPNSPIPNKYREQTPYKVGLAQTLDILMDTLRKPIKAVSMVMPITAKTIYNMASDSIFKQMLLPSDNFIAEQLLLTYADKMGIEMNASKVIDTVIKKYLTSLPDKPQWVDGSGLSRHNLFTPRDMVALLHLIYKEKNQSKLFDMLPAGGKSGTLKNAYPKTDHPFVFGKTGSLSNNHNQSGYLVTKKGKLLIFSFMNNNFTVPTSEVRNEMVRIMTAVHEQF